MIEQYIKNPRILDRMQNSHLWCVLDDYCFHLHNRGYNYETILRYLRSIEHFSRWISTKNIDVSNLNKSHIKNFMTEHLPNCNCPHPRSKNINVIRPALHQLLLIISSHEDQDITSDPQQFNKTINEFDIYLKDISGLAEATRLYRRRYVREFLDEVFNSRLIQLNQLSPKNVIHFITQRAHSYKSASVGVIACSLRSYFKFLQFNGHEVNKLIAAIPRVPNWKLTGLPIRQ